MYKFKNYKFFNFNFSIIFSEQLLNTLTMASKYNAWNAGVIAATQIIINGHKHRESNKNSFTYLFFLTSRYQGQQVSTLFPWRALRSRQELPKEKHKEKLLDGGTKKKQNKDTDWLHYLVIGKRVLSEDMPQQ